MYEDTTSTIDAILDEGIASCEVLYQVFIVHIIRFNHFVLERLELFLVEGQPQYREDMRNA